MKFRNFLENNYITRYIREKFSSVKNIIFKVFSENFKVYFLYIHEYIQNIIKFIKICFKHVVEFIQKIIQL